MRRASQNKQCEKVIEPNLLNFTDSENFHRNKTLHVSEVKICQARLKSRVKVRKVPGCSSIDIIMVLGTVKSWYNLF